MNTEIVVVNKGQQHLHQSFATRFGPKTKGLTSSASSEDKDKSFDNFFREVDLDKFACNSHQGVPKTPLILHKILEKGQSFVQEGKRLKVHFQVDMGRESKLHIYTQQSKINGFSQFLECKE